MFGIPSLSIPYSYTLKTKAEIGTFLNEEILKAPSVCSLLKLYKVINVF